MRRSPAPSSPAALPPRTPRQWGRLVRRLILFIACVLIADAMVGERGVVELLRAHRQRGDLLASIERLRLENAALRDQIMRLREDPHEIEALAREELGLIRRGEILFIVRDRAP